jgi:hypothetical protein
MVHPRSHSLSPGLLKRARVAGRRSGQPIQSGTDEITHRAPERHASRRTLQSTRLIPSAYVREGCWLAPYRFVRLEPASRRPIALRPTPDSQLAARDSLVRQPPRTPPSCPRSPPVQSHVSTFCCAATTVNEQVRSRVGFTGLLRRNFRFNPGVSGPTLKEAASQSRREERAEGRSRRSPAPAHSSECIQPTSSARRPVTKPARPVSRSRLRRSAARIAFSALKLSSRSSLTMT